MANHVSCHISFDMNDKAQKWLSDLCESKKENYEIPFISLLVSDDEEITYEKNLDLVGPKWSYISDFDGSFLSTYSAWTWPQSGIENLLKCLSLLDQNVTASVTFEDEMPNFFGACKYSLDENQNPIMTDDIEYDYDDLIQYAINNHDELTGKWDSEKEEWSDEESQEIFNDNMYDMINQMQEEY